MKTLIKILCLSMLWIACEEEDVYGCSDPDACNFNPDVTIFDNSCEYHVDECGECGGYGIQQDCGCGAAGTLDLEDLGWCDCNGNTELDCLGVCNGSSIDINNDGTCDYCVESEIFFNFIGYLATDTEGNALGGDSTDWNCCSTQEGIIIGDNNDDGLPTNTGLSGAYPNPFISSTHISLHNAQTNLLNLYVINQNGQVVDSILSETLSAGNYQYNWTPTGDIAGGLYRVMLNIVDSNDIHCFGDICYCPGGTWDDLQNCNELCDQF